MIDKRISPATVLVKATAAINVLGNFFGALLTLIYFGIFYPGLTPGSATGSLPAMSAIIIAVWISAVAVIGPINMSWVIPWYGKSRRSFNLTETVQLRSWTSRDCVSWQETCSSCR